MIRGVVFDLDGVLVATDQLHLASWRQLAKEQGWPLTPQIRDQLRGRDRMASLELLLAVANQSADPAQKRQLAERKNGIFVALSGSLGPADLLPGAAERISELRQRGIPLAVASSSRQARRVLRQVKLLDAFDQVVDATDVDQAKPKPDLYLAAIKQLGLPPSQCLAIEDAAAGVEAAHRAGLIVLGIGNPHILADADRCVPGLAEITTDGLLQADAW